jgi:hypothetical protein
MVVYVTQTGADRADLAQALAEEGVTYQECPAKTEKEMPISATRIIEISANLPEVKVPPELSGTVENPRAWRLPSGRLIITDMDGNLEQIVMPPQ